MNSVETIREFGEFKDSDDYYGFLNSLISDNSFSELTPKWKYSSLTNVSEKWFEYIPTGEVCVLIQPDFPYNGKWMKINPSRPLNPWLDISIDSINDRNREKVIKIIKSSWQSNIIVANEKVFYAEELDGFVAKVNGEIKGVLTYKISNGECEIITLDSLLENQGIGRRLIEEVVDIAEYNKCRRVYLTTTNDNIHAIRFYQVIGFELCGFHKDSVTNARQFKPEIPLKGFNNIEIKHELEFEKLLK